MGGQRAYAYFSGASGFGRVDPLLHWGLLKKRVNGGKVTEAGL